MVAMSELYPEDKGRLQRIEDKLDLILAHLGIKYVVPPKEEWQRLADAGRKIDAIKAYREQYGLGLLESKTAVERYQSVERYQRGNS